jgi:hypothetical protein
MIFFKKIQDFIIKSKWRLSPRWPRKNILFFT